jgi:hypothetical protein
MTCRQVGLRVVEAGTSGGSSVAQISCAVQHQVRQRQPDGQIGLGRSPASSTRSRCARSRRAGSGTGTADISATVFSIPNLRVAQVRKAAQARFGLIEAPLERMSEDQLAAVVDAIGGLLGLLRRADQHDRAEICARIGLQMIYRPGTEQCSRRFNRKSRSCTCDLSGAQHIG